MDSIKIKNFSSTKDILRSHRMVKDILYIPRKGLMSKIYKQFLQINVKRQIIQMEKLRKKL